MEVEEGYGGGSYGGGSGSYGGGSTGYVSSGGSSYVQSDYGQANAAQQTYTTAYTPTFPGSYSQSMNAIPGSSYRRRRELPPDHENWATLGNMDLYYHVVSSLDQVR